MDVSLSDASCCESASWTQARASAHGSTTRSYCARQHRHQSIRLSHITDMLSLTVADPSHINADATHHLQLPYLDPVLLGGSGSGRSQIRERQRLHHALHGNGSNDDALLCEAAGRCASILKMLMVYRMHDRSTIITYENMSDEIKDMHANATLCLKEYGQDVLNHSRIQAADVECVLMYVGFTYVNDDSKRLAWIEHAMLNDPNAQHAISLIDRGQDDAIRTLFRCWTAIVTATDRLASAHDLRVRTQIDSHVQLSQREIIRQTRAGIAYSNVDGGMGLVERGTREADDVDMPDVQGLLEDADVALKAVIQMIQSEDNDTIMVIVGETHLKLEDLDAIDVFLGNFSIKARHTVNAEGKGRDGVSILWCDKSITALPVDTTGLEETPAQVPTQPSYEDCLIHAPGRLMEMLIRFADGHVMPIGGGYAPQPQLPREEIDRFWAALDNMAGRHFGMMLMAADWNAETPARVAIRKQPQAHRRYAERQMREFLERHDYTELGEQTPSYSQTTQNGTAYSRLDNFLCGEIMQSRITGNRIGIQIKAQSLKAHRTVHCAVALASSATKRDLKLPLGRLSRQEKAQAKLKKDIDEQLSMAIAEAAKDKLLPLWHEVDDPDDAWHAGPAGPAIELYQRTVMTTAWQALNAFSSMAGLKTRTQQAESVANIWSQAVGKLAEADTDSPIFARHAPILPTLQQLPERCGAERLMAIAESHAAGAERKAKDLAIAREELAIAERKYGEMMGAATGRLIHEECEKLRRCELGAFAFKAMGIVKKYSARSRNRTWKQRGASGIALIHEGNVEAGRLVHGELCKREVQKAFADAQKAMPANPKAAIHLMKMTGMQQDCQEAARLGAIERFDTDELEMNDEDELFESFLCRRKQNPPVWFTRLFTMSELAAALRKTKSAKAVGEDGFSIWLLTLVTPDARYLYLQLCCRAAWQSDLRAEGVIWRGSLAKKPNRNYKLTKGWRDIWVQTQTWALIARLGIEPLFADVSERVRPISQSAYETGTGRSFTMHTLNMRAIQEQTLEMRHGSDSERTLLLLVSDLSGFFMSILHDIVFAGEKEASVNATARRLLQNMHSRVRGKMNTASGDTQLFDIGKGICQGAIEATRRSILFLTDLMRLLRMKVPGRALVEPEGMAHRVLESGVCDDISATPANDDCAQLCMDLLKFAAQYIKRIMLGHDRKEASKTAILASCTGRDGVPQFVPMPITFSFEAEATQLAQVADNADQSYRLVGTDVQLPGVFDMQVTRVIKRHHDLTRDFFNLGTTRLKEERLVITVFTAGLLQNYSRATPFAADALMKINKANYRALCKAGRRVTFGSCLAVHAPISAGGIGIPFAEEFAGGARAAEAILALNERDGVNAKYSFSSRIYTLAVSLGWKPCSDERNAINFLGWEKWAPYLNEQWIAGGVIKLLADAGLKLLSTRGHAGDACDNLLYKFNSLDDQIQAWESTNIWLLEGVTPSVVWARRGFHSLLDVHDGQGGIILYSEACSRCRCTTERFVGTDEAEWCQLRQELMAVEHMQRVLNEMNFLRKEYDFQLEYDFQIHASYLQSEREKAKRNSKVTCITGFGDSGLDRDTKKRIYEIALEGESGTKWFSEESIRKRVQRGVDEETVHPDALSLLDEQLRHAREQRHRPYDAEEMLRSKLTEGELADLQGDMLTDCAQNSIIKALEVLAGEYAQRMSGSQSAAENVKENARAHDNSCSCKTLHSARQQYFRGEQLDDENAQNAMDNQLPVKGNFLPGLAMGERDRLAGRTGVTREMSHAPADADRYSRMLQLIGDGNIFINTEGMHPQFALPVEAHAFNVLLPFARSKKLESENGIQIQSYGGGYLNASMATKERCIDSKATQHVLLDAIALDVARGGYDLAVFIDGAYDNENDRTAWALWLGEHAPFGLPPAIAGRLPGNGSAVKGELAAMHALTELGAMLSRLLARPCKILGFSDSESVCDQFENIRRNGNERAAALKDNAHVLISAAKLARQIEGGTADRDANDPRLGCVDIYRLPSHCRISGNHNVDAAATSALNIAEATEPRLTSAARAVLIGTGTNPDFPEDAVVNDRAFAAVRKAINGTKIRELLKVKELSWREQGIAPSDLVKYPILDYVALGLPCEFDTARFSELITLLADEWSGTYGTPWRLTEAGVRERLRSGQPMSYNLRGCPCCGVMGEIDLWHVLTACKIEIVDTLKINESGLRCNQRAACVIIASIERLMKLIPLEHDHESYRLREELFIAMRALNCSCDAADERVNSMRANAFFLGERVVYTQTRGTISTGVTDSLPPDNGPSGRMRIISVMRGALWRLGSPFKLGPKGNDEKWLDRSLKAFRQLLRMVWDHVLIDVEKIGSEHGVPVAQEYRRPIGDYTATLFAASLYSIVEDTRQGMSYHFTCNCENEEKCHRRLCKEFIDDAVHSLNSQDERSSSSSPNHGSDSESPRQEHDNAQLCEACDPVEQEDKFIALRSISGMLANPPEGMMAKIIKTRTGDLEGMTAKEKAKVQAAERAKFMSELAAELQVMATACADAYNAWRAAVGATDANVMRVAREDCELSAEEQKARYCENAATSLRDRKLERFTLLRDADHAKRELEKQNGKKPGTRKRKVIAERALGPIVLNRLKRYATDTENEIEEEWQSLGPECMEQWMETNAPPEPRNDGLKSEDHGIKRLQITSTVEAEECYTLDPPLWSHLPPLWSHLRADTLETDADHPMDESEDVYDSDGGAGGHVDDTGSVHGGISDGVEGACGSAAGCSSEGAGEHAHGVGDAGSVVEGAGSSMVGSSACAGSYDDGASDGRRAALTTEADVRGAMAGGDDALAGATAIVIDDGGGAAACSEAACSGSAGGAHGSIPGGVKGACGSSASGTSDAQVMADMAFLALPREMYVDNGAGLFEDWPVRRAAALRRRASVEACEGAGEHAHGTGSTGGSVEGAGSIMAGSYEGAGSYDAGAGDGGMAALTTEADERGAMAGGDDALAGAAAMADGGGMLAGAAVMAIDGGDGAAAGTEAACSGSVGCSGGTGGPMRRPRQRVPRPSWSTRQARAAAHARNEEPGGGG